MANACWTSSIIDEDGNALSGALVEVRHSETNTLATLFSGRLGGGKANPFTNEADGSAQFFVVEGTYNIQVSHASFGTRTYPYVVLLEDHLSAEATGVVSHAPSSGNNNDYDAGGSLDTATGILNLSPNAGNATITGLDVTVLRHGQTITVRHGGLTNNLVLSIADAASAANNRISGRASLTLLPKGACNLRYFSSIGLVLLP